MLPHDSAFFFAVNFAGIKTVYRFKVANSHAVNAFCRFLQSFGENRPFRIGMGNNNECFNVGLVVADGFA